jgi:hypothetical protein
MSENQEGCGCGRGNCCQGEPSLEQEAQRDTVNPFAAKEAQNAKNFKNLCTLFYILIVAVALVILAF